MYLEMEHRDEQCWFFLVAVQLREVYAVCMHMCFGAFAASFHVAHGMTQGSAESRSSYKAHVGSGLSPATVSLKNNFLCMDFWDWVGLGQLFLDSRHPSMSSFSFHSSFLDYGKIIHFSMAKNSFGLQLAILRMKAQQQLQISIPLKHCACVKRSSNDSWEQHCLDL